MFGYRLLFLTVLSIALSPSAFGSAMPDREIVMSVTPSDDGVAEAVEVGANGAVFTAGAAGTDNTDGVSRAKALDLDVWIGIQYPWGVLPDLPKEATGLALVFPSPQGEEAPTADLVPLMAIKRKGDALGESIRAIKKQLGASQKLAICAPYSEIHPGTAKRTYVPVEDLIRDGTVDVVCLSGAERYNFHRLRLLRDAPLRAGTFVDGAAIGEKARAGMLSRAVLAAMQNDTCECLWVHNLPTELVGRVITHTVNSHEREKAQREVVAKAIEEGKLVVDQEVPAKSRNNQATVHGVAQSFVPSVDGACPLVQVYAALRGCRGPLPPALKVEIRSDDSGKPGKETRAKSEIPAAEFGHEPTYRWGNASFDPPVQLKRGTKYWLYLPDASHPEGRYLWGIAGNGATQRGGAWSRRYDYTKHTWVFRVYLAKEPVK